MKKNRKLVLVIGLMLCILSVKAHQPDISTTMILEQSKNNWVVQVNAPLTAFQHEIKAVLGKTYATPEEFQKLLIEYLKANLVIYFNNQDTVTIQQAYVKLGHETSVVFEISGIPESIKNVYVQNAAFKDINKNQNILVIAKEGFAKTQYILNNSNQHTATLVVDNGVFKLIMEDVTSSSYFNRYGLAILLIGILAVVTIVLVRLNKKDRLNTIAHT
jgi:hypothetical protein